MAKFVTCDDCENLDTDVKHGVGYCPEIRHQIENGYAAKCHAELCGRFVPKKK